MAATFDVFAVADMGASVLFDTVALNEREALHKLAKLHSVPGDLNSIDSEALRKRLGNPDVRRYRLTEVKRG